MTILHANTDPDLLTRLRQMLASAARADIAVGYFFMSGFGQVARAFRLSGFALPPTAAPSMRALLELPNLVR